VVVEVEVVDMMVVVAVMVVVVVVVVVVEVVGHCEQGLSLQSTSSVGLHFCKFVSYSSPVSQSV